MIRSRRARGALVVVLVGAGPFVTGDALVAGTTRSFRQTTAKDFEEGEATAATVLPTGEVVAGMKATRLALDAAFVWCAVASPDGKTVYFGTGDEGLVHSVAAQVSGKEPAPQKVADLDAAWVTSLAVRPDGGLIAGTTPGGRLFEIDPKAGKSRAFAKVGAEHVWALVHDGKKNVTYAASGGDGKIFAVDAKGAWKVLWSSGDKQVTSLLANPDGSLLAGTAEQAIVYRVHADGRAEAVHDFEADEVRAVVRTSRGVYLAVNDFDKGALDAPASGSSTAGPVPAKGTRIALGPAPASIGAARGSSMKSRSAVYRLGDDGAVEQVFALSDGYLTALLPQPNGDVLAASGTQGRVYRLYADRSFALIADLSERQALTLAPAGDGLLIGTGDIGGVYRLRPSGSGDASYLSKVFDADVMARFGHIRFGGTPDLVFTTRSGNTAKPDASWGPWTKLGKTSMAAGEGEGLVASAPARYLQYRAALPSKTSVLRDVTTYYLPQNVRPRVTEITLADAAAGASVHSPVLKLRFRVENPDNDELLYRVWVRQESESVWRPVGGPEPLTKPELDLNTESFPDGKYVVFVRASDESSNPAGRALEGTFVSPPFLVDNGKPEVKGLASKGAVVTGRAEDAGSPIKAIEGSIDGGEWRPATPDDAILDQRGESFSFRLPANTPRGPHIVTVRAYDAADNVGSARVQLEVK